MVHDHKTVGSPIIVYNRGATNVSLFPGSMIAPADGTRRFLAIQTVGIASVVVYAQSGSQANAFAGIYLYPLAGSVTMTDVEDPDMIASEWWAFTNSNTPADLAVTEEIFR